MIAKKYWQRSYQDNLVLRVVTHNGKRISQGKRLPKGASNMLRRIQKAYVAGSTASGVRILRDERCTTLRDALKTFNVLRGVERYGNYWKYHT